MTYVLSDIHGNLQSFQSILEQIQLQPEDSLYLLGDVIDRHPHGIEILRQIMDMPNAHMLLGNHEYMMLDALGSPYEEDGCTAHQTKGEKERQWFRNGGKVTYTAWWYLDADEKEKLLEYLLKLPLEYDITVDGRKFKLVHATWSRIYDMIGDQIKPETKAYFSVWDRETIWAVADMDEVMTIFGHTPTVNFRDEPGPLEVFQYKNIIGIDCGAGFPNRGENSIGRLACIRLDDMQVFYSNENEACNNE